ncbi:predicted protein, partial [Nematostella vectensis]
LRSKFRAEPKDLSITIGNRAILKCNPPKGRPAPTVTWLKNTKAYVPDGVRIQKVSPGNLVISIAQKADMGTYQCVAANAVGRRKSRVATVTIKAKPEIIQRPKDVVIVEGNTALFTCKATGSPLPTVFWEKKSKGQPMFPMQDYGRFFVSSNGELRISSVKKEDEGEYVCSALSPAGLGASSARAMLTVWRKYC